MGRTAACSAYTPIQITVVWSSDRIVAFHEVFDNGALEKAIAPAPLAALDNVLGWAEEVYLPTFAVGQAAKVRVQKGGKPLRVCEKGQSTYGLKPVHTGMMLAERVSMKAWHD
ncbi:MAG: hypothetical protein VYD05_04740, partial [Planctomycetota bacterium]|nr:hypothetical protein [Planctomycetota bacterium]